MADRKKTLVLSNSGDTTADHLCNAFSKSSTPFVRFNTDDFCESAVFKYVRGVCSLEASTFHLNASEINCVVYRRPQKLNLPRCEDVASNQHRQGEWSEAVEGLLAQIELGLWINHPSKNFGASHKIEQLMRAECHGLLTPATAVTNDPETAYRFILEQSNRVVVKPLSSGYIERILPSMDTLIYTSLLAENDRENLESICECPVMFQQRIAKETDVRLTVVDRKMVAVSLSVKDSSGVQQLDVRRDNMKDVIYSRVSVPGAVADSVLSLMASYGLRFGALDFAIANSGEWYFFEINPNGQWAWLDICSQAGIADLFVEAASESTKV